VDPFVPYRLKVVRFGIQTSMLTLVALIGYRLMPGHAAIEEVPFVGLIAMALIGIVAAFKVPWARFLRDGSGLTFFYVWSALDILLITVGIGISGGARSELFLLYGLTAAFFGCSFPRRAQWGLLLFTIGCYVTVLTLTGWDITPAVLSFRISVLAVLVTLVAFVAQELMQQMAGHNDARLESERRASLLASVAVAARSMSALDPAEVLASVVEAARNLEFESTAVGLYDDEGNYRMVRSVDVPQSLAQRAVPVTAGVVGQVWRERRTVTTERYADEPWAIPELKQQGIRVAIATPIWSQGKLVAALVCGSSSRHHLGKQEVEAFEMLAAQTGAALYTARRFEDEHRTVERLSDLDRLKSDFLSNVSHELRTPLTVIIGNGKTLSEQWDRLDEAIKVELVDRLNANALSLNSIITTLLDFSRIEAGVVTPHVEPFDLRLLLENTSSRLSSMFVQHPLSCDIEAPLVVRGDVHLIDRVVENLLVNAVKHTPPGTRVVLTARSKGDNVVVEVRDNGPGIESRDLEHLGERFFRGGEPGSRRSGGTGLGLALAREVLGLQGSSLGIASRMGVGSRFWFELPLEAKAGREDGAAPVAAALAGS
jgi:signal transduction histidine kinase